MQKVDVVVVGGGIAGLTAAIYAAIAGKQTVLIEKQNRLGGRAISNKKKGAYFNLGAHSLYKGDAYDTFQELGLALQGKRPSSFAYGVWKGKLNTLPSDLKSLFTTPLLSWKGKMEFASCLMKVKKADTRQFDRISIREWVEGNLRDPMVRNIFYSLLRAASYVVGPDLPAAGPVLKQLQNALKGALYLDRGWGELIEEMRKKASDLGVQLLINTKVSSIDTRGGIVRQVLFEDGTKIDTHHVILATSPTIANELVPFAEKTAIHTWKEQAIEVTAACLDVALKRLPKPKQQFAYGIDQTILLSNYSRAAYLSDDSAQVISLIKYQGKEPDPDKDLQELEGVLDLMQPGWREELIVKQYLPKMTVCHDFMHMKRRENPGPAVPEVQGLYVAGEWASHGEVLVDAATASAKRAIQQMLSLESKERNSFNEHRGII
ncbi:NAD(P)/FAD-dependent oxidoreductase [Paenibacillus sp. GCM10023248]|uniref:NAD(P)/FAD-dependent oxidoreductase n=1 Tax=Bacillales TaxID=1385 RepID=UPI002379648B|nr:MULTISPECIES: NAD(P)/FAD-dependent oxidoreductase [Bacillales]MDD9269346.1 NAD(P)/FAD-dependent oxidoreductase [Paenibacillus sp. MAHUQ-63]MDR6880429.1 phytoene dehydrogenase-like protein [Bacillus sp. 3255]